MADEFAGLTLLVPERSDVERDAVAAAWQAGGGELLRLARFWQPPELARERVRVYGNDTFCLVLAQKLELELVSPADDLLGQLEPALLGRTIELLPLAELERLAFPRFIKSAVPKLFAARVYASAEALREETRGLEPDTLLIASDIVEIEAELRSFVLDDAVVTIAGYEGREVPLDDAAAFVQRVIATGLLPRTCVIDVGWIRGQGLAVIEANASWGAGLNGCDAHAAARSISAACRPA